MQTVLGLVIHRFDIHIKRETGCFDVRGSRSQGTAEVAHFFLLTQHSPEVVRWVGGWGCWCWWAVGGVWWGGEQIAGDRVYIKAVSGETCYPSFRSNPPTYPPQPPTHIHAHTYARPLRINHKITPILIPLYLHQLSVHTHLFVSSLVLFCCVTSPHSSNQTNGTSRNLASQKHPKDDWRWERWQWASAGVGVGAGNEAVSKIAAGSGVEQAEFCDTSLMCVAPLV